LESVVVRLFVSLREMSAHVYRKLTLIQRHIDKLVLEENLQNQLAEKAIIAVSITEGGILNEVTGYTQRFGSGRFKQRIYA
jgi:hypothetical protein